MQTSPIPRWHQLIASNDLSQLEALLADDAVFQSPAVHTPQVGKALVAKYLRAAMLVLNNPSFRYVEEWSNAQSAVLEFECTLDGIYGNGVDIIHWNEEGRITLFKVMLRPWKALNAAISAMGQQLHAEAA